MAQKITMDERMSRHEIEFAARFSSAVEQMANEGIGLSLPIVVIEHIYNSDCNLSVVRSQARKCAKEGMPKKNEDDEYYFSLFKIKEVTQGIEEGNTSKKKELMIILRCKNKAANYAVYYDINNRVEHKMRISVYVFDKEGCMYPDKTASKTPLNIAVLSEMFKVNATITRPKYVDNKLNRREVARRQTKERNSEEGYPKEIKMGELQLPPYLWFAENSSTPDPKGLAGETIIRPSTSNIIQLNSTPDPRQRGLAGEGNTQPTTTRSNLQNSTPDLPQRRLAGEDSHTNINALLQTNTSYDRRSVLIDESTSNNQRQVINNNPDKSSVFDRLGSKRTSPVKIQKEHIDTVQRNNNTNDYHNRNRDKRNENNRTHDQEYNRDRTTRQNDNRYQDDRKYQHIQQKSTPDSRQRGLAGENNNTYQEGKQNRRSERYGREALGKDAHERDTSRGSRTSSQQEQELTSDFYHKWKVYNNNKRQHRHEDSEQAKRPVLLNQ